MNLFDRIKGILLQPKAEWGKIDSEPGDAGYLVSNYVAVLAAVAPICTFIGTSIIGIGGARIGIGLGLFRAVVVYVLTLIGLFVVGYIALIYTIAVIICAIIVWVIILAIPVMLFGMGSMM